MKKFNLDEYSSKYVMNCKTEEEAKIFTRFLDSKHRRWYSGTSYLTENFWYAYGRHICYNFQEGGFADINYFKKKGYTILKFSDFDWNEEGNRLDIYDNSVDMELLKDVPRKKLKRLLGMRREQLINRIHILEYNIECLLNQIEED